MLSCIWKKNIYLAFEPLANLAIGDDLLLVAATSIKNKKSKLILVKKKHSKMKC